MTMSNNDHVKGLDFDAYKKFTEERLEVLAKVVNTMRHQQNFILSQLPEPKDTETYKRLQEFRSDNVRLESLLYQYFLGD